MITTKVTLKDEDDSIIIIFNKFNVVLGIKLQLKNKFQTNHIF